jgi:carbamoyltransferase
MNPKYSIGLGKTIFNSSVAILPVNDFQHAEIILTERLSRVKNSGAWPELPLRSILEKITNQDVLVSENRDVQSILEFEQYYDQKIPFKERLKFLSLDRFLTGQNVDEIPHHVAHAYSAILFSPFQEALVLILDGAGSLVSDPKAPKEYEYLSLYLWSDGHLKLLDKKNLEFLPSTIPSQTFSEGIGIFYEKASEFIFNNKTESGKVMGLSAFGKSLGFQKSFSQYLESLEWTKQFNGKSKKDWEESIFLKDYQNLAATVQENFEIFLFKYLDSVRSKWPQIENLIFSGGCALNCTFNGKLYNKNLFKNIFVPPNPGDEGVALGCAMANILQKGVQFNWFSTSWEKLTSSRGLKSSQTNDSEIESVFEGWEIQKPYDLAQSAATLLYEGHIIAFFQGRSECGPRALGNRSLLANPLVPGVKDLLNRKIKFRESFRPYGCTVQWEKSHLYFENQQGFENPFMSFAVKIKTNYLEALKEISHIDGTSRIQTLHKDQNSLFYEILGEFERLTGFPILLNTSLNIMNEPIVETIHDTLRFMNSSSVDILVIEDYIIKKNKLGV